MLVGRRVLLEATLDRALTVVKGRLDRRWLQDEPIEGLSAVPGEVSADLLDVLWLVFAALDVDTKTLVSEDRLLPFALFGGLETNARSEGSELVQTVRIKLFLVF